MRSSRVDGGRAATAGLLLLLVCAGAPWASVRFSTADGRVEAAIPSVTRDEGVCVSVTHLCERVGGTWRWDVLTGTLRCMKGDRRIEVVRDMRFFRAGDSTVGLVHPPRRQGGGMFLAADGAAETFSYLTAHPIRWRPEEATLVMKGTLSSKPSGDEGRAANETVRPPMLLEQPRGEKITTIVIDAGHGGRDPGAIGPGGTLEKDVVLGVALALRDELKKRTDLSVHMTRSTDVFVELRDRTNFANEKNADLFVSIHANSIGGSRKKRQQVKGYKVYFLSHAKSEDDRRVAMLENSVVEFEKKEDTGNFLQNILVDMAANEFLLESQEMSILLAETFGEKLTKVPKLHTGVGQGPFWVLYGATMPSVLVETGFISNPREEKTLADKKFHKELAVVICDAILEFKRKYERGL